MISSAADLMYVRGVNAVTLDDVRAATGTSKSQLYKHFPDGKPELVRAVVALRAEQILAREDQRLARLKSMSGLRRWRDALVQGAALQGGAYGCALGNWWWSFPIKTTRHAPRCRSTSRPGKGCWLPDFGACKTTGSFPPRPTPTRWPPG